MLPEFAAFIECLKVTPDGSDYLLILLMDIKMQQIESDD